MLRGFLFAAGWRRTVLSAAAIAAMLVVAALPSRAETARTIVATPLKLIGDGAATAPPPAMAPRTVATPPLRLVGDGAAASAPPAAPAARIIETLPLKLIGGRR